MKGRWCALLAAAVLCTACGANDSRRPEREPASGGVTVTFPFTRQRGMASNQFAVWVEDDRGGFMETLYVTRFTAKGGWEKRPEALPDWVSHTGVAAAARESVEAVAGATPKTGEFSCRWDCTDGAGNVIPPGIYRIYVEGTLRWENRVLYTAEVAVGGEPGEATAQVQYFGEDEKERGMIGPVAVRFEPLENEVHGQ